MNFLKSHGCWVHILNFVVQDGLLEIKDLLPEYEMCRAKYIKASAKQKLEFANMPTKNIFLEQKCLFLTFAGVGIQLIRC